MRFSVGSIIDNSGGTRWANSMGSQTVNTFGPAYYQNDGDYALIVALRSGQGSTQPSSASAGWTFYDSQAGGSTGASTWIQTKQQVTTNYSTLASVITTSSSAYWISQIFTVVYPRSSSDGTVGSFTDANFNNFDITTSDHTNMQLSPSPNSAPTAVGTHFIGNGKIISKVRVELDGSGSTGTGTLVAKIYSSTGTAPTALPNNLLATSTSINATDITPNGGMLELIFPSTFQTTNATQYWIVLDEGSTGAGTDYVYYSNTLSAVQDVCDGATYSGGSWSNNTNVMGYMFIYQN